MTTELAEFNGDGIGHGEGGAIDLRGSPKALEAITRAEIDVAIATAKRYPRSPQKFLAEARTMVSISPELAAQCRYRLPARRGGDGAIEGPSVRLAEICVLCWGNMQVVGRIVDDDGRSVTAQGIARDLERNVAYSVEVRRGVTSRKGQRYSEDMVRTTCNAAISIATRNATFKAIPRALVALVEEEAERVARGDARTLPERTAKALAYFASRGVSEADVFRTLGVNGPADMTLDHLVTLQGYRTAVQDGSSSVADIFAPSGPSAPAPAGQRASAAPPARGDVAVPGQPSTTNGLDERPYPLVVSEAIAAVNTRVSQDAADRLDGELPEAIVKGLTTNDIHMWLLNAVTRGGLYTEAPPSKRQHAVAILGRIYGQERDWMRDQLNIFLEDHIRNCGEAVRSERERRAAELAQDAAEAVGDGTPEQLPAGTRNPGEEG